MWDGWDRYPGYICLTMMIVRGIMGVLVVLFFTVRIKRAHLLADIAHLPKKT